jgi:hypothetical protein
MIRRLMVPITVAIVTMGTAAAYGQSSFPAPLPGQAAAPASNSPFPPVNGSSSPFPPVSGSAPSASVGAAPSAFPSGGAAPIGGAGAFSAAPPSQSGPGEQCMKGFLPLREEAEKRGKMIKAASDRKAAPDEACKLIGNFSQAEIKMLKFVEANSAKCGIPPQVADQLRAGHKNTEGMLAKVCNVAQQMKQARPAGPSLSEVIGAGSAPEANTGKKGGSTFDTLNGNVLTR